MKDQRKSIFIIGAGTLAKLLVDIIESSDKFQVGGFFDDNFADLRTVLNYAFPKPNQVRANYGPISLVIGIDESRFGRSIFGESRS